MIPLRNIKILNVGICNNIESIAKSMIIQLLFPDQTKISSVTPAFKKDDRKEKKNHRQSVYNHIHTFAYRRYYRLQVL